MPRPICKVLVQPTKKTTFHLTFPEGYQFKLSLTNQELEKPIIWFRGQEEEDQSSPFPSSPHLLNRWVKELSFDLLVLSLHPCISKAFMEHFLRVFWWPGSPLGNIACVPRLLSVTIQDYVRDYGRPAEASTLSELRAQWNVKHPWATSVVFWAVMIFVESRIVEHILLQHFCEPILCVFLPWSGSACQLHFSVKPGLFYHQQCYCQTTVFLWLVSLSCQGNHADVCCL